MSKRGQPLSDSRPQGQWLSSLPDSRWAALLAGGVIVFALLAAYHCCFSVPFLFDDRLTVAAEIETTTFLMAYGVFATHSFQGVRPSQAFDSSAALTTHPLTYVDTRLSFCLHDAG